MASFLNLLEPCDCDGLRRLFPFSCTHTKSNFPDLYCFLKLSTEPSPEEVRQDESSSLLNFVQGEMQKPGINKVHEYY